jgi:hypothetical protein
MPLHDFDPSADGSIDAGLHLLTLARAGRTYSHREIGFVCGCSWQLIWQIEQRALRKLKAAFERRGIHQAFGFVADESESQAA